MKRKAIAFLRWTEQYTKTDMLYLAKGSFWLNTATAINTVILFIQLYAFGNYLSPDEYGTYRYLLSWYGIFTIASLTGFNTAVTQSVARGFDGDFYKGFKIQIIGSLVGTFIALCGTAYYYIAGNTTLAAGLAIIGIALPLMESLDIYGALLNGKKKFEISSKLSVASQLVASSLLLVGIFMRLGALPILALYFSSWIIAKLCAFLYATRTHISNNNVSGTIVFQGFNFSAIGVLNIITSYFDRITLYHYMGARDLALYSMAIAPSEQIKGLFKNTNALLIPKFSQRTEKEIRSSIARKVGLAALVALGCATAYSLLAPYVIPLLLPKYTEIIFHSQVYSFSLLGIMVIPLTVAMNTIPRLKALYLTNTINPLIYIGLALFLIPQYGLWGAIAARGIARIVSSTTTYIFFLFA